MPLIKQNPRVYSGSIKCISLCQPWASLICLGAKSIETRSWKTSYRGPLAIHASKSFPKWARDMVFQNWSFFNALDQSAHTRTFTLFPPLEAVEELLKTLPLGSVIATCRLVDCKQIVTPGHVVQTDGFMVPPPEPEFDFGDYTPGRYAWILEDVKPLSAPVPAKGALALWKWDEQKETA